MNDTVKLTAMNRRMARINLLASEITGLKARVDEKVTEIEKLAAEIEAISRDSPTEATQERKDISDE